MIPLSQFMSVTLADRERELAGLYPDNYRSAMFLDDVQAAERKVRIDLLRREVRDLKTMIKLEKHHAAKNLCDVSGQISA